MQFSVRTPAVLAVLLDSLRSVSCLTCAVAYHWLCEFRSRTQQSSQPAAKSESCGAAACTQSLTRFSLGTSAPVFHGTRIPVYLIPDMVEQGPPVAAGTGD